MDLKRADVRRTFAIVVDDLGMAWENVPAMKEALRKFVEQDKQPNDLVAILSTSGGMGIFEQFTTDPKELLAAIDHLKYNFIYSRGGIESFASLSPLPQMRNPALLVGSRIQTMQSIMAVVRGLANLPGRKILLVISESLPVSTDDLYVQQIGDQANRASVVIYGVDPRGLPTLQLTAADNTADMTMQQISQVPLDRSGAYFRSQSGLYFLTRQTGGLFFHDNNDLAAGVRKVSADTSGYYLIGYQPDADTFRKTTPQAVFRKLEVRVRGKGLHVRLRAGFFSVPSPPPDPSRVALKLRTRQGQIQSAFASPFSSDTIHVQLTGLFVEAAAGGSWIQGLLYIDAKDLNFSLESGGKQHASIEVVTMTNGDVLRKPDFQSNTVDMRFDPGVYESALRNGIQCTIRHKTEKPGFYQLKVVLRDNGSQEIGSANQFIEVPDLTKKDLALSGILMHGEGYRTTRANPQDPASVRVDESDPEASAAVRIFHSGGKVLVDYEILNAHGGDRTPPDLTVQTRLFRNGKEVYSSAPEPYNPSGQTNAALLAAETELTLGSNLEPGEYVLQVIVTDKLAPRKYKAASQSIDFEIRPPPRP